MVLCSEFFPLENESWAGIEEYSVGTEGPGCPHWQMFLIFGFTAGRELFCGVQNRCRMYCKTARSEIYNSAEVQNTNRLSSLSPTSRKHVPVVFGSCDRPWLALYFSGLSEIKLHLIEIYHIIIPQPDDVLQQQAPHKKPNQNHQIIQKTQTTNPKKQVG